MQNVKKIMEEKGLNPKRLEKLCNLKYATIYRMVHDKEYIYSSTTYEKVKELARAMGVEFYDDPPPPFTTRVIRARSFREKPPIEGKYEDYIEVPIVSEEIAAGEPREVSNEEVDDIAWIHRNALKHRAGHDLVCIRVKGISMEPLIRDGAIVCIDRSDKPNNLWKINPKAVWAVRDGKGCTIKYVQPLGEPKVNSQPEYLILIPENKDEPVRHLELKSNPDPIIGRVVWVWQELG